MNFDWNDLRYLLAIADHGSTIRAAEALKVSQTTVSRRIEALEHAIGLKLVDRTPSGYALTIDGDALIERARGVEAAALAFGQAVDSGRRALSGIVRITTEEIFAVGLLGPILKDLASAFPDIRIQLDTSEAYRDLAGGDADIAIRSSREDIATTGTDLAGRRVGNEEWAIFCSKAYARERGAPRSFDELKEHPIIGGGGASIWTNYRAWLDSHGLLDQVSMQYASATGLFSAVRAGLGVAMLPMMVGLPDPELELGFRPVKGGPRSLWLLSHDRARHNASVRKVSDFLFERLRQRAVLTASLAGD